MLKIPLQGIVPPMITPLKTPDSLDCEGLENLVNRLINGGVHGIFLLGTTGEGPSLCRELQFELVTRATKQVAGRLPVLVGISSGSFSESLKLAEHAADCGADALVLAPPYYFPSGQPELLEYLGHLAPRLPLPLFLYNMPSMTKVSISVDTLRKASEIENIIGCKDSSGNMIQFHEFLTVMRDRPDFSLLIGPEELMAEAVLFGGHGGVPGGANICPKLYVELYNAARAKDTGKILDLQQKLFRLRALYSCGHYSSTFIKGVKCSLNILGVCSDVMAEPFHAFLEPERRQVEKLLRNFMEENSELFQ